VFVLPSDEETKKNTVTIGSSFTKCSNLEVFYFGFDKCVHEKWEMKQHYYAIFEKDTHGTFICPSANCDILDEKYLVDRTGNFAERNWELKVGTTISNALPPEEAAKQLKATIAAEEKNLYDKTMPIVKRYLDSIGFELPPDESLLFMQIDENTGKWKYTATVETTYDSVIENEDYVGNGVSSKPGDTNKYIVQSKKVEYACNSGILLTPEGKAYIAQTKQSYWYRFTESGIALDSSICLPFDNVLAVGNITNQLLGGIHFSDLIASHDDGWDLVKDKWFTNSAKKTDVYFLNYISGGLRLKRVFILPSNEQEKKNTVVIGPTFDTSPNLSLFYCGFDKCVHEKSLNYKKYYAIFDKKTHGVFITPSADCDILDEKYLVDRGENIAENNWELRVGTTLQNAVSPKLTAAKEEISKLEAAIAAKKAEMASLGMDAQAIVKKARLNMQIKELEPEIEALKAEVEKLGK